MVLDTNNKHRRIEELIELQKKAKEEAKKIVRDIKSREKELRKYYTEEQLKHLMDESIWEEFIFINSTT